MIPVSKKCPVYGSDSLVKEEHEMLGSIEEAQRSVGRGQMSGKALEASVEL